VLSAAAGHRRGDPLRLVPQERLLAARLQDVGDIDAASAKEYLDLEDLPR
jgi:hypothetical protein